MADTNSGSVHFTTEKLFRMANGEVIGCAGDIREYTRFIEWYESGEFIDSWEPHEEDTFEAICAYSNGCIHYFDNSTRAIEIKNDYIAIGIAADVAMGAMYMGADADIAVKAACELNVWCRLPIRIEKISKEESNNDFSTTS